MGMFSKDSNKDAAKQAKAAERQSKLDARAQSLLEKARAKALKKGVEVEGALIVAHTFDDSADQFLVVFPDRVEHVRKGKVGSLFRSGAGAETISLARISSVEGQNKGVWYVLQVHASGNSIEFKTDQVTGPIVRQIILDLLTTAETPQSAAVPVTDIADQIKKLADLHAAGILSDEEFSAKKAELLNRM